MTKVHEILGVQPGELFKVKGEHFTYKLDEFGNVYFQYDNDKNFVLTNSDLPNLINNPSLIIRNKYTEEEKEVFETLKKLGYIRLINQETGVLAYEDSAIPGGYARGRWMDPIKKHVPNDSMFHNLSDIYKQEHWVSNMKGTPASILSNLAVMSGTKFGNKPYSNDSIRTLFGKQFDYDKNCFNCVSTTTIKDCNKCIWRDK